MIQHIVLLRLKPGVDGASKAALLGGLETLRTSGAIPGIVSVSGGDLRPLTAPDDQGSAGSAFFSSDGSRVVYVSTIEGSRSDLFTVSVSGGLTMHG